MWLLAGKFRTQAEQKVVIFLPEHQCSVSYKHLIIVNMLRFMVYIE